MKKKRLLAVFAAFTVATTMAIGFSACKDDNSGNNTQPEQDEEAAGEAVTEEQWAAIWEEAKNFNHEGTIKGTQIASGNNIEADVKITYFAEHDGYLFKALYATTKEEQESPVEENVDIYYQFTETDIIVYMCGNDGIWHSQTLSFDNYNILMQCAYPGILYVPLRKTEDGENVYFSDCYDIATFDDTTKEYGMKPWIKIGASQIDPIFAPVDIRIKIVDGHLSELTITIRNYSDEYNPISVTEMIVSYKFGVEVDMGEYEVPEEVLAN